MTLLRGDEETGVAVAVVEAEQTRCSTMHLATFVTICHCQQVAAAEAVAAAVEAAVVVAVVVAQARRHTPLHTQQTADRKAETHGIAGYNPPLFPSASPRCAFPRFVRISLTVLSANGPSRPAGTFSPHPNYEVFFSQ